MPGRQKRRNGHSLSYAVGKYVNLHHYAGGTIVNLIWHNYVLHIIEVHDETISAGALIIPPREIFDCAQSSEYIISALRLVVAQHADNKVPRIDARVC